MTTPIIKVAGVGSQTAAILSQNGYLYAEDLAAASEKDLLEIHGFGPSRAKIIIESARDLLRAESDKLEQSGDLTAFKAGEKKKKAAKESSLKQKKQKKKQKDKAPKKVKKEKDKEKKGKKLQKKKSASKKKKAKKTKNS